ncbi:sortase B protein-sorting domain-containing protein [Acinetobacter sp. WZC-1]
MGAYPKPKTSDHSQIFLFIPYYSDAPKLTFSGKRLKTSCWL